MIQLELIIENVLDLSRDHASQMKNDLTDEDLRDFINACLENQYDDVFLSVADRRTIIENVYNSMRGLDILQPLVDDHTITEIMINGTESIFVEKDGRIKQLSVAFKKRQLEEVVRRIVEDVNRTANESSPICDARLKDGSRVSVVMPPIALNGPLVTIRKFPEVPMTMDRLVKYEALSPEIALILNQMVRARLNIFISGGTGSGKTSFLNALSNFIPSDERIITIEDSAELQIANVPNLARLETRDSNSEGVGAVVVRDLIKSSLRMRPDRIIVGEVRGAEALEMLQAMNTGHDGSLSTGHANSVKDMLSRLETMVLSGASIPLEAIRQQIASAIDIIIQLGRLRDKSRKVLEIAEVVRCENGQIVLNTLYKFQEQPNSDEHHVIGKLVYSGSQLQKRDKIALSGININFGGDV